MEFSEYRKLPRIRIASGAAGGVSQGVFSSKSNGAVGASLLGVVFLWGGNNVAVKHLVAYWPVLWIGASRMVGVGLVLLALLRWTKWFGPEQKLSPELKRAFWWRGGLSLAAYAVAFTASMRFTSASHVALYMGTAPVWALLWEGRPQVNWDSARRYGAAGLAVAGVAVLFWPNLKSGHESVTGDSLAVLASVLWTNHSRQCRALGTGLTGGAITAHTMWRAGVILSPLALAEVVRQPLVWRGDVLLVQGYCILIGGVVAFALWNNALKHWPTRQVFLMSNLIPITTMGAAYLCLHEPVTQTFWVAMGLIMLGVMLGQANWQKILGSRWLPE